MGLSPGAVGLTVASNVLYHVSQKSIPADAHPLPSLTVTYVVALVLTLLLCRFYPGAPMTLEVVSRPQLVERGDRSLDRGRSSWAFCSRIAPAGGSASARP